VFEGYCPTCSSCPYHSLPLFPPHPLPSVTPPPPSLLTPLPTPDTLAHSAGKEGKEKNKKKGNGKTYTDRDRKSESLAESEETMKQRDFFFEIFFNKKKRTRKLTQTEIGDLTERFSQ
jgi:hypothetical protein